MRWCAVVLGLGLVACGSSSVFPCSSDVECVIHFAAPRSDAWIAAEHRSFTDQLLVFGMIESH